MKRGKKEQNKVLPLHMTFPASLTTVHLLKRSCGLMRENEGQGHALQT
jgi:hypothetical protein